MAAGAALGLLLAACGGTTDTAESPAPAAEETASGPGEGMAEEPTPTDESDDLEDASPEDEPSEPEETATPSNKPSVKKPARLDGTRIRVAGSPFGRMLYDGRGQAIYLFDLEKTSRSECYGACADAWPPVLTDGKPRAVDGARQGLLGTTERRDGTVQVTYAGQPLYYYAHERPWQVLCHDIEGFGGLWLVVRPNGEPAP